MSNAADRSSKIRTENWPLESAVCTGHWWDWKNRLETSTNLEKMKSDSKQLFANITVGCRRYRIYWTAKLKRSWEHWISVLVRWWNKYKPGEIIEGSYAKHLGQTGCRSHIKWILLSINHKKKSGTISEKKHWTNHLEREKTVHTVNLLILFLAISLTAWQVNSCILPVYPKYKLPVNMF